MAPVTIPRRGDSGERPDTPHHFERVRLRGGLEAIGWPGAFGAAGAGIAVAVVAPGSAAEVLGAVLAAAGGVVVVGLVRCRSYEIVVGRKWLQVRAGPIRDRVPIGLIDSVRLRPATGWRRLYADAEIVVTVGHGGRELAVPTRAAAALAAAVDEMRAPASGLSQVDGTAAAPSGRPT